MENVHDQVFLQILQVEKNIVNFLDAFFGFLYRCTDFYVESKSNQTVGFSSGIAEKLVLNSLHKWKNMSQLPGRSEVNRGQKERTTEGNNNNNNHNSSNFTRIEDIEVPPIAKEVDVEVMAENSTSRIINEDAHKSSDCYNGAARENYTWSQSINDLDVIIHIPQNIKSAKDLQVNIDSERIKVDARTCILSDNQDSNPTSDKQWTTIFNGELCYKTKKDESVWSIVPKQYINIHLEKAGKRWWEAFIVGEPKISLNKIDCSQNLHELESDEQMKLQELMWNHQQTLLGKPTSNQIQMEQILKKAWDAKGSPFQGMPYDPSIVKFN